MGVVVGIVEEHGTYHRLAVYCLVGYGIGVRHEHRLKLQIRAVDACSRLAEYVRILGIGSPTVHVELHRCEGLPLELAHIHRNVLASEYSVHVARDVWLTRQARTYECRDVEAYVFPVASGLVAAPYGGITLRSCPSVERNDERTCIRSVVRHDLSHVSYTVQSERIAVAYPCHVGLQHSHSSIAHLLDDVALQQRFYSSLGMKVALRPQTYLNALRTGIVAKLAQVVDVAIERTCLSITGSISVIGEEPSQRHIVVDVAVDGCTCRELIVVLLAVKALLGSTVVLLAFLIHFAILKHHRSVLVFLPIVAVVGIQMAFVKTELRHQNGVARELIEVVEQLNGSLVKHYKHVEIVLRVLQTYFARSVVTEVVASWTERIPHHSVATGAPVERCGRCYATVNPTIGVLNGNTLATMRETTVLHSTSIKVLAIMLTHGD